MGHADIRDHTDIRACDRGEAAHFAEMINTHLQNRDLVFFIQLENSKRKPPFIIEVAKCFVDFILLCKYRSDHFLGAGLSDAAGDAYDLDVEGIPVELGDVQKRLPGGLHQNIGEISFAQILVGNHTERPFFDSVRGKAVSVVIFSVSRDEMDSLLYMPEVDH